MKLNQTCQKVGHLMICSCKNGQGAQKVSLKIPEVNQNCIKESPIELINSSGKRSANSFGYIDTNGYRASQLYQISSQPKQIQVSQFIIQEGTQQSQNDKNNLTNKTMLSNIHRIASCKKQAEQLLTQIEGYIYLIKQLKKQNKDYQAQLDRSQKEKKKLRDELHLRDMEIFSLVEERDRFRRMQITQAAKVRALKDLMQNQDKDKWDQILRNKLEQIYEQEIPPSYSQHYNCDISLQLNLKKNNDDFGLCGGTRIEKIYGSAGSRKQGYSKIKSKYIDDNPEGTKPSYTLTNTYNPQKNRFGQIVRLRQNGKTSSVRNKWMDQSTIA